ncbi:FkbM family methyltransferase [Microvirga flavescens]|uniref:FkbM family methyltransferase n=1 Tax=Microvirga flavescens TaxID=2249811 RepID=UPI000DD71477|nr:FkbM family methyltransferase [Microvirga flavescens]
MSDSRPYGAYAPSGLVQWLLARTRAMSSEWPARRFSFLLRNVAIRLLKGQPLDVEALGAKMRIYPYRNVCEKKILFTPQFFDPQERAVLESRIKEGFTFVDIGANVGGYTLFVAARAGNKAKIVAIEPQPDIFDRLTYNISQNPFGTVKAIACAIADKAGELTLFLDPNNKGESSVKIVGPNQSEAIRVPAIPLLDLIRQEGFSHVDAVKLDVEGAEDLILDPFLRDAPAELLPSLLLMENGRGQWQIDLQKRLEQRGYKLILQTRMNLVFERVKAA